jgi:hypothetical protein
MGTITIESLIKTCDQVLEKLNGQIEIPISYLYDFDETKPLKFSENAQLKHIWKIEPKVEVDFSIWDW